MRNAVSWAIVLILPQIKLNSQLSHCAFFSVDKLQVADHDLQVHRLPPSRGPEAPEQGVLAPLFPVVAAQPQVCGKCQANVCQVIISEWLWP